MIIKSIEIEKFRAFENVSFYLGRRITAIAGRNATQKTTVLGMIGQPFTISKGALSPPIASIIIFIISY